MTAPALPTTITADQLGLRIPRGCVGRSGDGFLAARVADSAFAMLPAREGRRISRPAGASAGRSPNGSTPTSTAIRASSPTRPPSARRWRRMPSNSAKRVRSAAATSPPRRDTRWGPSFRARPSMRKALRAPHSTAGHGGFHLSAERNRSVHSMLRARGGWYEEDEGWAIVAITFPNLFTSYERRCAERTIRDVGPTPGR